MELNELRIGNWFLGYDNKPFQWDLQCFTYLTPTDIERALELDEIIKEPIPLTEKWLLAFGFELITDKDKGFRRTLFHMRKPCWTLCKLDIGFGVEFWQGNQLKYVHQLQNLYFALTGEELTKK